MGITEQHRLFEEWMGEHGAIVYRVVNGFADSDDRNDLLQEILLAVWKSIPAFRAEAKPTTFLYRVCHNAALLWRRKEQSHRRRVEQFDGFSVHAQTQPGESNDLAEERLAALYTSIRQLAPVERSLILMSLDGVSYREIAAILGLSESNVGVKLSRIKQRLTQTLKETEHELR
jgi:RNA polymerase sigma-70 factor (ECF subfamily)